MVIDPNPRAPLRYLHAQANRPQMVDSESACPWGRENRAGQGRRAKLMLDCMGEPEDAVPATIRNVIQGSGEFGIHCLKACSEPSSATDTTSVAAKINISSPAHEHPPRRQGHIRKGEGWDYSTAR